MSFQFLVGTQALSVLGELSPGGALMSGTTLQKLHRTFKKYLNSKSIIYVPDF